MGLGTVKENNALYLSIAGGFIWDRKADSTNPNYSTQEFTKANGEVGERKGAKYADITGMIKDVEIKQHPEYGESINVSIASGGEKYIISITTNTKNSQDMMRALLLMDLKKPIYIKPYDFTDRATKKRAQGISFKQDGEKIDLKTVALSSEFKKEKEFFSSDNKKKMKRYFEDLSDWFVSEIEQKVIPTLSSNDVDVQEAKEEIIEEGVSDLDDELSALMED